MWSAELWRGAKGEKVKRLKSQVPVLLVYHANPLSYQIR